MKSKKIIRTMAMVLASSIALSACSSGTNGDSNTSDTGNTGDTENTGNTEVVQLKFAYWGDNLEKKSIESMVTKFNAEHPNINVVAQQIPGDNYMEKINTMASNNTLPDVGYMKENSMAEWGANGMLKDLSPLYEAGGAFEYKFPSNNFQFEENGPIYGSSLSMSMMTLLYNKKYTDSVGIEIPYNVDDAYEWDEFVEVLKELTVDRNGNHPDDPNFDSKNIQTYGINNFTWMWESFTQSNGGGTVSQDGKQILIATDETIEALERLQDLMYVHHVMPEPSQASNLPAGDIALLTDRVALNITGSWDLRSLGAAVDEKGLELGIGVVPKMQDKSYAISYGAPVAAFNTEHTNENWEEVQTFLEYAMNPEGVIDIINSGLWQPNDSRWYTEPELIEKWTSNSFTPEHFEEALLYPTMNNVTRNKAFFCEDTTELEAIIGPALDQVWLNKKEPRDVVMEDILPKIQQEFGDKYEIVIE